MSAQLMGMPMHQRARFGNNHKPMTIFHFLYPFHMANKARVVSRDVARQVWLPGVRTVKTTTTTNKPGWFPTCGTCFGVETWQPQKRGKIAQPCTVSLSTDPLPLAHSVPDEHPSFRETTPPPKKNSTRGSRDQPIEGVWTTGVVQFRSDPNPIADRPAPHALFLSATSTLSRYAAGTLSHSAAGTASHVHMLLQANCEAALCEAVRLAHCHVVQQAHYHAVQQARAL